MKNKFLIKNNIQKEYIKNQIYKKNKILVQKKLKNIYKNIGHKKDTFHSLSENFKLNFKEKDLIKFKKFKNIVIIGMGGSILGAEAIYSFLKNKIKKQFFFIDNLNECKIINVKKNINLSKTLFIIISKSGNTLETLTNYILFKNKKINSKNMIIITENKNNILNNYAKKNNILKINHKDYIGGRYSVLSEVGLLPAYLMGLKTKKIRKNILDYLSTNKKKVLVDSVSKLSQIYLSKKFNSIVFFNYCPEIEKFLYWCQQLIAESLGKNKKGLMPIISSAPKDQHSLLQLYLDGPRDKLFYIISSNYSKKLKTKHYLFENKLDYLNNKKIIKIIEAQKNSFIKILQKKKIPFREFKINETSEESIGEMFSYFIIETALIGIISGVNPYNQPGVEELKVLTKKFLS